MDLADQLFKFTVGDIARRRFSGLPSIEASARHAHPTHKLEPPENPARFKSLQLLFTLSILGEENL